jgi:SAM-dependent methyltransferase
MISHEPDMSSLKLARPDVGRIERERSRLVLFVVTQLMPRFPRLISNHHFREWFFEPLNYWRQWELPIALSELRQGGPCGNILDIGSPKLLALYLAWIGNAECYATDLSDYFVSDFRQFRELLHLHRLRFQTQDGRHTDYPPAFFDAVCSISVIEHIPGDGDLQCVDEVHRLLKIGGLFVFTLPVFGWPSAIGTVEERFPNGQFHQRRYSLATLKDRILSHKGFELQASYLIAEVRASYDPDASSTGLFKENCNILAADPFYRRLRWATKHSLIPLSHYVLSSAYRKRCLYLPESAGDPLVLDGVFVMKRT